MTECSPRADGIHIKTTASTNDDAKVLQLSAQQQQQQQQPKLAIPRGFHRSSCSIVYRKRMIAFRRAKLNTLATVVPPSKDRVSPTSILSFPSTEATDDTNHTNTETAGRIPVSVFQPVLPLPPPPLTGDEDDDETVLYSHSLTSFADRSRTENVLHQQHHQQHHVFGGIIDVAGWNSNYRRIWHSSPATTTNTDETTTSGRTATATTTTGAMVQPHPRQHHRSCLRSSARYVAEQRHWDDGCHSQTLPRTAAVPAPLSSSSVPSSKSVVVFNETMEVRYFTRSQEEVAIMKQCAADRRLQYKARRLRRQRQQQQQQRQGATPRTTLGLGYCIDDDDDDDDSYDDECKVLNDTDGYVKLRNEADDAVAVVYRCGQLFQETMDDDCEDDEPSFLQFRGRRRRHHHHQQQTAGQGDQHHSNNPSSRCTPHHNGPLPSSAASPSNMLQDMVDEITGLFGNAMVSVKQSPRQPSSSSITSELLHPKDETITLTSTSSSSSSLVSLESLSESVSPPFSHPALSDTDALGSSDKDAKDDEDGPWLFSALHCGGR